MTEWYSISGTYRPTWIADDDKIKVMRGKLILIVDIPRMIGWGNPDHSYYIPANHWAVAPLRAGYEPWPGGERAPADWDGGEVLLRIGTIVPQGRYLFRWDHEQNAGDIIGYRKRAAPIAVPVEQPINMVRLKDIATCLYKLLYGDETAIPFYPSDASDLLDEIDKYIGAIEPRDMVVRTIIARLRTLPAGARNERDAYIMAADILTTEFLPPSDVEKMAREMHAVGSCIPWDTCTQSYREGAIKSAQWAMDHGARL